MATLTRENIAPRVITIIHECLGVRLSEISEDDSICNDLGADSLDIVELAMLCEDEFGVEFAEDQAQDVDTVAELIDLVKSAEPVA